MNRAAEAAEGANEEVEAPAPGAEAATTRLLEALEALHQRFDAGGMSLDDFEEQKSELLGRLTVE